MRDHGERPANRSPEELAMREIIAAQLRKRWPSGRLIHELPLRYSSNRLDLATVTEREIIAVEIKSSRDTLQRLERQLRAFAPICSRIIVALAPKWNTQMPLLVHVEGGRTSFREQLTEAQQIIRQIRNLGDPHIETWTVSADDGTATQTNGGVASNDRPWPARLLDILHVAELERIAVRHCVAVPHRRHDRLVMALCGALTGREAQMAACRALRERDAFDRASDAPLAAHVEIALEMPHA